LKTHYRQPIDWTVKALEESRVTLQEFYADCHSVKVGSTSPAVLSALSDDLNTPRLLADLHALRRSGDLPSLRASLELIGFSCVPKNIGLNLGSLVSSLGGITLDARGSTGGGHASRLLEERIAARAARDWAKSDLLRKEIEALGFNVFDNKDGTSRLEPKP